MSNNRLSVHVPDGVQERVDDLTGEDDVKSDVLRDALKKGLDELERDENRFSRAMIRSAQLLAVAGASIATLAFLTKTVSVFMSATILLAGAIGVTAFEHLMYRV